MKWRWLKTAVMGSVAFAQVASPPSGNSSLSSPFAAAPSNVCVTQYGVCPVSPPGTTRGAPCQCFVPPGTWVPGVAEYWVSVPSVIP
jgi:hypothetical protein